MSKEYVAEDTQARTDGDRRLLREYVLFVLFVFAMTGLILYGISLDGERGEALEAQRGFSELGDALEDVRESFDPQAKVILELCAKNVQPVDAMEVVASEFTASNELVTAYVVVDAKSGRVLGLQDAEYITEASFTDLRGREFRKSAPVSGYLPSDAAQRWMSAVDTATADTFYMLVTPMYTGGEYLGLVGLLLDTEYLADRYLQGVEGLYFLTDGFGNILQMGGSGPKPEQIIKGSELNPGGVFRLNTNDKSWLCAFQKLSAGGTVFRAVLPQARVTASILVICTGLAAVLLAAFGLSFDKFIRIKLPNDNRIAWAVVLLMLVAPFMLHLLAGGFGSSPLVAIFGAFSGAAVCMPAAIVSALLWLKRRDARRAAYLYTMLLFAGLSAEVFIMDAGLGEERMLLFACLLLTGLVIFTVLEIYVKRSSERCEELESEASQLKSTQSLLVQREKMGTLGQLIAGIAHELNTPIGAIKASSESLAAAMLPVGSKLIEGGRSMSKSDQLAFYALVELAVTAINEMKSTVELRRSKAQLRGYLESMEIDRHTEILELLSRLEICEIEKVEMNLDLFRKENIVDILKMVTSITPFITGTQTILFAAGRVSKIVFALKSYAHSNPSSGFLEFDVIANIENVLVLCHNQIKKGITLIREIGDLPKIRGNPDEMGQVWTNLIQNGIYAMNERGTLTIIAKKLGDDRITVTIKDSGSGMDKDVLDKIFQPLYTTKPLGEGSGLGLDICRKIVEAHSGKIYAASEPGLGSAFTVELPVNPENPQPAG